MIAIMDQILINKSFIIQFGEKGSQTEGWAVWTSGMIYFK
jgi:hypothetical protein